MTERDATAEASESTPLESTGLVCARAAFVAIIVGLVEGIAVSRTAETSIGGIGLATAGLWFPIALLFLAPAMLLRRVEGEGKRRILRLGLGVALAGAVLFARFSHLPMPLRMVPAEVLGALALAWAAIELRLDDPIRRPVAYAGLFVAVGLQFYSTQWVDAHRAFASLLAEGTMIPRFMLRVVLRRFA